MKNKEQWKQYNIKVSILILLFLLLFLFFQYQLYDIYKKNSNQKINAILVKVQEEYPNITENELIEILNSPKIEESFVDKYGINIKKESLIVENDDYFLWSIPLNLLFFGMIIFIIIKTFCKYNKERDNELEEITKLIEQINSKNYLLSISTISEDELSILKNEIYKTTLMLKEEAENSIKDKRELKDSLSDISHQLKTPLTSILIMLDNMIDNPDMKQEKREEFLHDIKREITNIEFLIKNLLKLSKLDSNTVNFLKKEVSANQIVEKAIENVSALCDLKNIIIEKEINQDSKIFVDEAWQIEAVTNILKNSVEYSNQNGKVNIKIESNPMYVSIIIKDYGEGIKEKELPFIWNRFYKGSNRGDNSIGIGLALSKTIIENNNGVVSAKSDKHETVFQIKYFKD